MPKLSLRLLALLVVILASLVTVPALASSTRTVKVADSVFGPKRLTIGRGTKVLWRWTGVLQHNVVVHRGPAKFQSRVLVRGSYSHTFTKRGTYFLVCTIHPHMNMTVVVH